MSAKHSRLSLSRKRQRNTCSCSPQIEVLDVDEDLNFLPNTVVSCGTLVPNDEAPLPELHTPLLNDYAKQFDKTTLPSYTMSSEQVYSERTHCKDSTDREPSSGKKSEPEGIDDIGIFSQDWRACTPQSALDNSILNKKQTNLHSFFSCTPAMRKKFDPTTVVTKKRTTSSLVKNEQQNFFCGINRKTKSNKSWNSKSSRMFSSTSSPVGTSMAIQSHNMRPGRNVSDQETIPYLSHQLRRSQSDIAGSARRRVCPQYKWIPGTRFAVDAFSYGAITNCVAFFLTHFHSDHYQGLGRHWDQPIYCSKITANLVMSRLHVPSSLLHPLPLNRPSSVNGIEVIPMDANHCPGSVMLLFKLPDGKNHLHTGDFRASKEMQEFATLSNCHIHTLLLDTTYCKPSYNFPSQKQAIAFCVSRAVQGVSANPSTLIICGTYCIGKERIFLAIAEALGCQAYVSKDKQQVLACLESEHVSRLVTASCPTDTPLHVLPLNRLNFSELQGYLQTFGGRYSQVIAFRPTGWTHHKNFSSDLSNIKPSTRGPVTLYGVPYSEHSSYSELRDFVQFLRPDKVVSTVGGINVRLESESHCLRWLTKSSSTVGRRPSQTTLDQLMKTSH